MNLNRIFFCYSRKPTFTEYLFTAILIMLPIFKNFSDISDIRKIMLLKYNFN